MSQINFKENNEDGNFNWKNFLSLLIRNKVFICAFSTLAFILACLYSLTLKRVWMGQFEIVLENKQNNSGNAQLSLLSFTGLNKSANTLTTEVGILQSQAVLMPIYEFVMAEKKKQNPKYEPEIFSSWKISNFQINLKEKTSIVNISYKDTKRNLIIPTLEKISKTYQVYSGKNKKRQQELAKIYLKDQISIFKKKSSKSLKLAQDYAIDKDLYVLNSFSKSSSKINNNFSANQTLDAGSLYKGEIPFNINSTQFAPNIDIEMIRLQAANEIKTIDQQIKKIEELGNDLNKIKYISVSIPGFDNNPDGLPTRLDLLEEQLLELRSRFTEKDSEIMRLKEKRNQLIKLLKQRAIGYLKSMKIAAEAKMESAQRPKEVLFKYKDLLRQSARDESTLISLEDNLRTIELDEAKIEDPWQLITKPTLLINPVAPSRKRIGLLGLLGGLVFSIFFSYLREKKSGVIYDDEILENIFDCEIIEKLSFFNPKLISDEFLFLEQFLKAKIQDKVSIISSGKYLDNDLKNFKEFINYMNAKYKQKNNWIFIDNSLDKLTESKYKLVLATPGYLTSYEANNFQKRLRNLNEKLSGILILNIKINE